MTTPHTQGKKRPLSTGEEQDAKRSHSANNLHNIVFHFNNTPENTTENMSQIAGMSSIGTNTQTEDTPPNNPGPSGTQRNTIAEVVGNTTANTPIRIADSNQISFRTLRRLSIRKKKAEHHLEYLLQCLERKTSPKGLTSWIEPNLPTHDPKFFHDWMEIHRNFSSSLTQRLVTYWQGIAEDTSRETEDLSSALRLVCADEEYNHIITLVNKYVEKDMKTLKDPAAKTWQGRTRNQLLNQNPEENLSTTLTGPPPVSKRQYTQRQRTQRTTQKTTQSRLTNLLTQAIGDFLKDLSIAELND
jgi:hypothetical protein